MPQHHMVIPHYMGKGREINVQSSEQDVSHKDTKKLGSLSSRSSCQDIPLLLPQEPDGLAVPNGSANNELDNTCDLLDHPNRTSQNQPFSFRKTKVEHPVQDMQMKGFVDDIDSHQSQRDRHFNVIAEPLTQNMDEWWETQERGSQVVSTDEARQVGPRTQCRCQVSISPIALKRKMHFTINFKMISFLV